MRATYEKIASVLERHEKRRLQIGGIVNGKAQNVRKARRASEIAQTIPPISDIAAAFQPKNQIISNAVALHEAIRGYIGNSGTLRIAVFFPAPDGKANSATNNAAPM